MADQAIAPKKVAVVTGGNRGIGKEIALSLAKLGVGVVLTYRSNKSEGEQVVEEIQKAGGKAVALDLDVSVTASFDGFLEQLRTLLPRQFGTGKIDFLINNARFGKAIPIEKPTEKTLIVSSTSTSRAWSSSPRKH